MREGYRKSCIFQPISRGISETVQDIMTEVSTNRKSHTRFPLVPKSSTLDDLEGPTAKICAF